MRMNTALQHRVTHLQVEDASQQIRALLEKSYNAATSVVYHVDARGPSWGKLSDENLEHIGKWVDEVRRLLMPELEQSKNKIAVSHIYSAFRHIEGDTYTLIRAIDSWTDGSEQGSSLDKHAKNIRESITDLQIQTALL